MNTHIISIANQKGGVSKTTTCLNLGILNSHQIDTYTVKIEEKQRKKEEN